MQHLVKHYNLRYWTKWTTDWKNIIKRTNYLIGVLFRQPLLLVNSTHSYFVQLNSLRFKCRSRHSLKPRPFQNNVVWATNIWFIQVKKAFSIAFLVFTTKTANLLLSTEALTQHWREIFSFVVSNFQQISNRTISVINHFLLLK